MVLDDDLDADVVRGHAEVAPLEHDRAHLPYMERDGRR
jgi:hypothetical protein